MIPTIRDGRPRNDKTLRSGEPVNCKCTQPVDFGHRKMSRVYIGRAHGFSLGQGYTSVAGQLEYWLASMLAFKCDSLTLLASLCQVIHLMAVPNAYALFWSLMHGCMS